MSMQNDTGTKINVLTSDFLALTKKKLMSFNKRTYSHAHLSSSSLLFTVSMLKHFRMHSSNSSIIMHDMKLLITQDKISKSLDTQNIN